MSSTAPHIPIWETVVHSPELLDAVKHVDATKANEVSRLRQRWTVEEVNVALALHHARSSAVGRLDNAQTIVADPTSVQQASSTSVAKWKAKRFDPFTDVVDLCCGIGVDLDALPQGAVGVEIDPLRCWMASQNTGKHVCSEDARQYKFSSNSVIHVDPSRRDDNGRRLGLDEMQPNISEVQEICANSIGGCVKLSPAIDLDDVECIGQQREIEYIEHRGRVVQGLVWFDSLANTDVEVSATSLTTGTTLSGTGIAPPQSNRIGTWIYEPNPALERAKLHGTLAHALQLWEPALGLGLLCADCQIESQWFTTFEVLETTTLRREKIAAALHDHNGGEVEVKTRSGVIDPDKWQKQLQKPASETNRRLTVFAIRLGERRVALITRRVIQ